MRYLRRLRRPSTRSSKSSSTNWSILLLLITGVGSFVWYTLNVEQPYDIGYSTEVDQSTTEERSDTATTTNQETPPAATTDAEYSGTLRVYRDTVTNIEFSYPVEWGVVSIEEDDGECPNSERICTLRRYMLQDPRTGDRSVFAAAVSDGYRSHPPGRGGQWYDQLLSLPEDLSQYCTRSACTPWPSESNLAVARLEQQPHFEGDSRARQTRTDIHRYAVVLDHGDYTHLIFSTEALPEAAHYSEAVLQETVISSLSSL